MKKTDIKRHLQDYSIFNKRKTTVNHAFASALSIADNYDEKKIDLALEILGQDPNTDLLCAYCDSLAETWDHIKAVVKDGEFSGHGHQISNLIPCCKDCNSKKGNKDWLTFLKQKNLDTTERIEKITKYISQDSSSLLEILETHCKDDLKELDIIKQQVFALLKSGDERAEIIREKIRAVRNKMKI